MKSYLINDLRSGMKIAEPVFTSKGQIVMDAGTVLTSALISRLSYYNIRSVSIEDPEKTGPAPAAEGKESPAVSATPNRSRASNPSYSQKVKSQPEFMAYQIEYSKEVNSLREVFDHIIKNPNAPINIPQILNDCSKLTALTKTTVDLFDKLHNMRLDDDSVYSHCLNVALIARQMGKWMHFSPEDLDILTLCGLFHDIGKVQIPDEVLNKPGKYTDEEFALIRQHPAASYHLLKNLPIDERIKHAALMHHERCDGSGYPQKLKSAEIDDFAEIIAIADVYDAMTAARSYRSPLCPFQAINMFEKDGLQLYSPKYILTFLNRIANTYQNNRVLLNNGQSANIVMINSKHLTRPMIQLDDGSVVDMLNLPEWEIIKII
ncbi:MAG: HD-GYP domain-containing protein [Lachnospiraceae bacterium]|nr:HD-GYP domain-containing protein [Lachnospiraceae bacterium]